MRMGQAQHLAHEENAHRACGHTRSNAQGNRIPVFFQQMQLLIQRDCQTDGGRGYAL